MAKNTIEVWLEPEYRPWEVCAKEESRPVLTGIFLDPRGWMVAADGFGLAAVPCRLKGAPRDYTGSLIPGAFLKEAHKARLKWGEAAFITLDLEKGQVEAPMGSGKATAPLLEGEFPNWRQLIPQRKDLKGKSFIGYNPQLGEKLRKALGEQTPFTRILVNRNGGPSLMLGYQGAFGLIMPAYLQELEPKEMRKVFALRQA